MNLLQLLKKAVMIINAFFSNIQVVVGFLWNVSIIDKFYAGIIFSTY